MKRQKAIWERTDSPDEGSAKQTTGGTFEWGAAISCGNTLTSLNLTSPLLFLPLTPWPAPWRRRQQCYYIPGVWYPVGPTMSRAGCVFGSDVFPPPQNKAASRIKDEGCLSSGAAPAC